MVMGVQAQDSCQRLRWGACKHAWLPSVNCVCSLCCTSIPPNTHFRCCHHTTHTYTLPAPSAQHTRSQPPLLSAMVRDLYEALTASADSAANANSNTPITPGGNTSSSSSNTALSGRQLLQRALPLLLREHSYWSTVPKAVTVQAADGSTHNFSRCARLV